MWAQTTVMVVALLTKWKIALVFRSPKSMITCCRWREMFRQPVYQENLMAVVVDEAHCLDK